MSAACQRCLDELSVLRASVNDMLTAILSEAERTAPAAGGGSQKSSAGAAAAGGQAGGDLAAAVEARVARARASLDLLEAHAEDVFDAAEQRPALLGKRTDPLVASAEARKRSRSALAAAAAALRGEAKRQMRLPVPLAPPVSAAAGGGGEAGAAEEEVGGSDGHAWECALDRAVAELSASGHFDATGGVSYRMARRVAAHEGDGDHGDGGGDGGGGGRVTSVVVTFGALFRAEISVGARATGAVEATGVAVRGVGETLATSASRHAVFNALSANAALALGAFRRAAAARRAGVAGTTAASGGGSSGTAAGDGGGSAGLEALGHLLRWLGLFHDLFSAPCTASGKLLLMDPRSGALLPPVFRTYPEGKALHTAEYLRQGHAELFPFG